MADLTKVGPAMLNMDDITAYLHAKKFLVGDDPADDTRHVAGVDADRIAIADVKADGSADRTTVRNANFLEEHPASYFMTAEDGGNLVLDTMDIKKVFSSEIAGLRDEVYQLRNELAAKGITERIQPYSGFYDPFIKSMTLHNNELVGLAAEDSSSQRYVKVLESVGGSVLPGDHLYVYSPAENVGTVVTVKSRTADNMRLDFSAATGFNIIKDETEIYKCRGSVIDGTYTFGQITDIQPGAKDMFLGLVDDTYHTDLTIDKDNTGFGYTFRIPREYVDDERGVYLKSISIDVQAVGDPDPLVCYLIDSRDIGAWKNPFQAEADGLIIARSNPLKVDKKSGRVHIENFSFYNATAAEAKRTTGSSNADIYPLLRPKDENGHLYRYCMIIAAGKMNSVNDRYIIRFLQHKVGTEYTDLQLNNITYSYTEKSAASAEPALKTDDAINATDLFYGVILNRPMAESFTAFSNGIYNAAFDTHEPVMASRARVTLRINREGLYHAAQGKGPLGDAAALKIEHDETGYDVDFTNYRNARGESKPFAVGTGIVHLASVENQTVTIEKGLYSEYQPVFYPIGYEVSIKARLKEWNPDTCKLEVSEYQRFELPLVTIMPDKYKASPSLSDRLVFEADLGDEEGNLQKFNDFEVEIYWSKSCANNNVDSSSSVSCDESMSRKLCGAIHRLTVSLDETII